MKLANVEISGFRGFREKCDFEFAPGFVVLTGRNGVGKSTVIDAIDFAVTGTINKYSVTTARGGGLDDHIWWTGDGIASEHFVRVTFVDKSGGLHRITRRRHAEVEIESDSLRKVLCLSGSIGASSETLMRTSIIRDETIAALSLDLAGQARFNAVRDALGALDGTDHAKRMLEIQNAAEAALNRDGLRLVELKADLARRLNSLTEMRSAIARQEDVLEAEKVIYGFLPDFGGSDRLRRAREFLAARKAAEQSLSELFGHIERVQPEQAFYRSPAGRDQIAAADQRVQQLAEELEAAKNHFTTLDGELDSEHVLDDFISSYAEVLVHGRAIGLQQGHCPLCQAVRSDEQFLAALEHGSKLLEGRNAKVSKLVDSVEASRRAVERLEVLLKAANVERESHLSRIAKVEAWETELAKLLVDYALAINIDDREATQRTFLREQERTASIERALFVLESSSLQDQLSALSKQVEQLRAEIDIEEARLVRSQRAADLAKQLYHAAQSVSNQVLVEQFETVLPLLKELYLRLRPHAEWREIETDFGGKVRASLNFVVGDGKNPQFVFSSGQRRAAGLAFLLAVHLSRHWCSWNTLMLDDPVQHIDDYRALNLVEVLAAIRTRGRQIVIAVEDQLLAELVCRRLRSSAEGMGRMFEIVMGATGSAQIAHSADILPLPKDVLKLAS